MLELLVVILVLGILMALLATPLGKAREAGRATACLSNLRQIGLALQLYAEENGNRLPIMRDQVVGSSNRIDTLPGMERVLARYVGPSIFRCPSDRQSLWEQTGSSYAWNSLVNGADAEHLKLLNMDFATHQVPLVFDKEPFHRARGPGKGVNYLYADGHIKNLLTLDAGR